MKVKYHPTFFLFLCMWACSFDRACTYTGLLHNARGENVILISCLRNHTQSKHSVPKASLEF